MEEGRKGWKDGGREEEVDDGGMEVRRMEGKEGGKKGREEREGS